MTFVSFEIVYDGDDDEYSVLSVEQPRIILGLVSEPISCEKIQFKNYNDEQKSEVQMVDLYYTKYAGDIKHFLEERKLPVDMIPEGKCGYDLDVDLNGKVKGFKRYSFK
jgi:hypothetical protein